MGALTKSLQLLAAIITVYLLIGVALYFNQEAMIYHPGQQDFNDCTGFEGYERLQHNTTRFYYLDNTGDHLVVHYHGNAGTACQRSPISPTFGQPNNSVLFVEYSGYAGDNQSPSQELLLQDVRNIHDFIEQRGFDTVTVYGQSIGTATASYHAYVGKVDTLILTAPFTTLADVGQAAYPVFPVSWFLSEEYDNTRWLADYQGRLLVQHGAEDTVIPPSLSRQLFKQVPSTHKEYALIEGAGHNTIWESSDFRQRVRGFLNKTG